MANLRIKKKHIDENAIDGTKIKLLQNEAIKAVDAQGSVVDLVKLDASGFVEGNGKTLATYEQLMAQITERTSADSSLDLRLDVLEGEETVNGSVKKSIKELRDYTDGEISTEESRRISADEFLRGLINDEIANRIAADGDEQSARITADGDEQSARITADNSLETAYSLAVSTEASLRSSADASLSSRIDILQGDEDTSGSLLKIYNDSKIYTDAKVSVEESQRMSADDSLESYVIDYTDGEISTEESRRISADEFLRGLINDEIANRIAADGDEQSARITADGDEQSARITADNSLETAYSLAVSTEASLRSSADASLSSRIDILQGDEDTSGSLLKIYNDSKIYTDAKVSVEESQRMSADDSLEYYVIQKDISLTTAILREIDDRVTEDQNINGRITTIETSILGKINTEEGSRKTADSSLSSRLDTVQGDENTAGSINKALKDAKQYTDEKAINVSSSVVTLINTETTSRQIAVSDEASYRVAGDNSLTSRLNTVQGDENTAGSINKALKDAKDYTNTKFDQEKAWRESADTALSQRIDRVLSNTDPAALDSLAEIVEAFQSVDGTLSGAIANISVNIKADLSTEVTSRVAAVSSLDNRVYNTELRLNTVQGDENTAGSINKALKDAKDYTNTKFDQEKAWRESADTSLNSKIGEEAGARTAGDESLTSRLNVIQADENTAGSIARALKDAKDYANDRAINVSNSVVEELKLEITSRQIAVSDEASYRVAGDNSLTSRLNTVQGDENTAGSINKALKDAKDYTNTKFDQEKAWRESADTALSQRIDRVLSNTDPAALDSLAEIVEAFQSVDGTLSGAIANISVNIKADLSTEVTSRVAAVSSLDNRVYNTELRLNTIQGNGEGSIYQSEQNGYFYTNQQFNQEKTWRENADSSLDSRITNEISTEASVRYSVDEDLNDRLELLEGDYLTTGSIANMLSSAKQYTDDEIDKEEGSRTRQIDLETTARIAAINNEADVRRDNDDLLSGRITDEVNDRVNAINDEEGSRSRADASLSSEISTESSTRAVIVQNLVDDIALEATARIEGDLSLEMLIDDKRLEVLDKLAAEVTSRRQAIADLVDSAPEVLDTLKELADALGGDQNFATTISERLGALEGSITAATSALEGSVTAAISTAEGYTDTEKQDVLSLISNTLVQQETVTITAQNVQDGFVPLTGTNIVPRSMMVFIDRLCMFENVDYSLSVVDGVTNLTFLNSFAAGGVEEIDENTVLRVTYWSVPT